MHGSLLQQAEGEAHLRRTWHMPSLKSVSGHFLKDGRTICVGDCSLFKPPQNSPPFIGIIRGLIYDKEDNLHLHVNWLYRQADLKLGKGILLESAPNEIFYSFHKDKVPAASLLHPCKVAFLPKGVELPPGTSAFVCRRVYDIESNRLWWLTDQDYVNELQEEVDQLLYKTRIEMHGTVPTGGRSPKPINGPSSTSQLRPGSDSMQNHSHGKGKKRERGDRRLDPVKRESSVKPEDGSSCLLRTQSSLRSEIAKITEKGGLVDSEGVDKLVHLMQPDKVEKKMDLWYCSMLAGVIAATDKFDCLNRFVQLKGLPVLDEWLQNVHKQKTGSGSNLKDSDKFVEEFLLVLLSALDKLPVNLNALQMCNIGKSVNLLSKHKNLEIQRKAKSLVDTWKKRVEAEFNIMDAKSGSNQSMAWSSKSRLPEASHGGNRVSVGSADMAAKSTVTQSSSSKASLNKPSPGEATRSASSSSGPGKNASSPTSVKDSQHKTIVGGSSEVPPTMKDNRSSSSSQSHNYGQSSPSGKEDAKSPNAGASSVKVSSGSRHRKSVSSCGRKDSAKKNSSSKRVSASEKITHSGSSTQKPLDPSALEGSIHKLIVKIPNVGRSPVRSAGGGSVEDHSALSGPATSPLHDDKHDQSEQNGKPRSEAYLEGSISDVNVGSWRSNDSKDIVPGRDNADLVSASLLHEDQTRNYTDVKKVAEISEASSGSSGNKLKPGTSHNGSTCSTFRSMNALIESCVKYSEANTPLSIGDDVGMNLLASVAAGEMTRSDLVSPLDSPQRNSYAEEAQSADDARSKPSSANGEHDLDDKNNVGSMTWPVDGHQAIYAPPGFDGAIKRSSSADCSGRMNKKVDEVKGLTSSSPAHMEEKQGSGDQNRPRYEERDSMCHGVRKDSCSKTCGSLIVNSNVILDEIRADMKVAMSSSGCSLEDDTEQDVTETSNPGCRDNPEFPSKVPGGVEVLCVQVSENDVGEENVDKPTIRSVDISKNIVSECERDPKDALPGGDQSMIRLDKAGTDPMRNSFESGDEKKHNPECPRDGMRSAGARELKVPSVEAEEKECASMTEASSSGGGPDSTSKMNFDLNEGFSLDDGRCGEQNCSTAPVCSSNIHIINPMAVTALSPITVAAAAKGPFVPPEDLLRSKRVLGWKGSAATSAFRPAEPRKIIHASSGSASISLADASINKSIRVPLGFDLNVPDEGILEEQASKDLANGDQEIFRPDCGLGGFDLDLNRTDESSDVGICSANNDRGLELLSVAAVKPMTMGAIVVNDPRKAFDLNFGPSADDTVAEQSSSREQPRSSMSTQPLVAGLRVNGAEIGNYCSLFPPSNSFSTVVHPSILPEGAQHPIVPSGAPARVSGPSGTPFTPDVFRGSVLSSSPAVPFAPNPFQVPVYPLGTTFPLPSASFSVGPSRFLDPSTGGRFFSPPSSSQLMAPPEGISSQYPRPYIFSHPGGNCYGIAESKFGRQGLDLNTGLGSMDVEGRAEVLPVAPNRITMLSSQSVAEEQAKIYQVGGRGLRRKELDRGWDNDNYRAKRPS